MKIVSIFAEQLFALHYDNEEDNEYDRLMELWTDVSFLKRYAEENNINSIESESFINEVLGCAEQIQDFLERLSECEQPYGLYFEPLSYAEKNRRLAFQKGKIKKNTLRYYAIKLDENCFVITGGSIKMSQKMQEHPDTNQELIKLKIAKAYFEEKGVFDEDSFYELSTEEQ